jgi:hypothetical protein
LINLGFKTEGKLAAVLITPSLGVPNWSVIYIINTAPPTSFLAPLPGIEPHFPTSTTRQQNAKQGDTLLKLLLVAPLSLSISSRSAP